MYALIYKSTTYTCNATSKKSRSAAKKDNVLGFIENREDVEELIRRYYAAKNEFFAAFAQKRNNYNRVWEEKTGRSRSEYEFRGPIITLGDIRNRGEDRYEVDFTTKNGCTNIVMINVHDPDADDRYDCVGKAQFKLVKIEFGECLIDPSNGIDLGEASSWYMKYSNKRMTYEGED